MRFLFVCLLSIASVNAFAITSDSLKILFIGNSYTHMNNMPKIFERICKERQKRVIVQMNTQSGASFKVHYSRNDMFEAIKSKKWDYIVLQGYSRELSVSYDKIDQETVPPLSKIIDSIRLYNPCSNILFYMTWGYKNGFNEALENDTYEKMTFNISNGYRYIASCYDFPIVPVGLVWAKVRAKYPTINLYDADEAHPNKNGSYLSACTFYCSIFRESVEGVITGTIDSKVAASIQKEASSFVLNNLTEIGLDRNYFEIESQRTNSGKYKLTVKASFSNTATYTWDLGNGEIKNEPKFEYYYKKPGIYRIKLSVNDFCGSRVYTRTVKYVAPPKPLKYPKSKPTKKVYTKRKN
jgi:hypothetical protein